MINKEAHGEINYNRSVVNQLLYFSIMIIGAYFWLIINVEDKVILELNPNVVILLLSICIIIIIGLIGVSISKQLQQENVQWKRINEIEKSLDSQLSYDGYKIIPRLYSWILLIIFCFLSFINITIFNWCVLIVYGWTACQIIVAGALYVLIPIYGYFFYQIGIKEVELKPADKGCD